MSSTPEPLTIVNTSPLLCLHQIRHLDILCQLYQQITVPMAVEQELETGKLQGIDVPELSQYGWMRMASVTSQNLIPHVIDLGLGEAEVIAIGLMNPGSLLILDDQLGRRIAGFYQQKYTGTLGVLIKAKQMGYFVSIKPLIQQLQNQGMWLTEPVIQSALRLAGEV